MDTSGASYPDRDSQDKGLTAQASSHAEAMAEADSARNGTDRGLADRDDRRPGPCRAMRPRRVHQGLAGAGTATARRPRPGTWLTTAARNRAAGVLPTATGMRATPSR
jgi:hypothetical protein